MTEILMHLWGDYLTQSDWMAQNKTKSHLPAAVHALVYSLPFLFVGSGKAVAVIALTHFLIDRYRLARYVVWAKNQMGPWTFRAKWSECSKTGYPDGLTNALPWLTTWLMIIADNTLHLTINHLSLRFL